MTTANTSSDAPLSAEAAALAADELAAHAAAAPSTAADQAATAAAMTDRGPALPAEADIETFMANVKSQMADMQAQINVYKQMAADAQAAAGVPFVVRYAQGAADKVTALAAAHPDAPQYHFQPALQATAALADAATSLSGGTGSATVADLQQAAAAVETFATKTHWRTWAKHIDWSAVLGDVEEAVSAGLKLAA